MAAPRYSEALWPDPVRVAGVRLQPLTLGHALLLQRLRSPYATGAAVAGLGDLLLAVYVCSRPWKRAAEGIHGRWFGPWIRWRGFRCWRDEERHAEAFARYLADAWAAPRTWRDGRASGSPRGSDILQVLVVTQRSRWGKSLAAALDTLVAEAVMDHIEALEAGGALRVWGPLDDAMAAKLDEIASRSAHG